MYTSIARVNSEYGSWVVKWFHTKTTSTYAYVAKFMIALLIFFAINYLVNKLVGYIHKKLKAIGADPRMLRVMLGTIKYAVIAFVISIIIVQWLSIENRQLSERIKVITWNDVVKWLHAESSTVLDYILKVILAITIYVIIGEVLKKIFGFIEMLMRKVAFSSKVLHVLLVIVRGAILAFIVTVSVIQLFIVEYNTFAAYIVLAFMIMMVSIQLKKINFRLLFEGERYYDYDYDDKSPKLGKVIGLVTTFIYQLSSIVLVILLFFGIRSTINYLTGSGGMDITAMIDLPENAIARDLGTSFKEMNDEDVSDIIKSEELSSAFTIRSDGELDIIYKNGNKVGVNINSRKYRLYGVGINQTETKALEDMFYNYEGKGQSVADLSTGNSKTYYYYNETKNDCFAVTINDTSNRVTGLTYYSNYLVISDIINFTSD